MKTNTALKGVRKESLALIHGKPKKKYHESLAREDELIRVLAKHPTPTDIVARALKAERCDITLHCKGNKTIIIRGDTVGVVR
jgi:hypothetical protein